MCNYIDPELGQIIIVVVQYSTVQYSTHMRTVLGTLFLLLLLLFLLNYFYFSLAVPGGVWARADISSDWPQCNVGLDISHLSDMRVATGQATPPGMPEMLNT